MMSSALRDRLARPQIVLAPGVYDPLTALIAAAAGFEALYLSGAAIAYTRLGRPDIGLVSMSEVAQTIALIRDRIETPLIVDADTGFGNALNTQRTIRLFEQAGASAIQLEDQTYPKRCGHLAEKTLIDAKEMTGKVKAAVDARRKEETLIIARTDALASEGQEAALERAALYAEAGADILFIEAPGSGGQLAEIGRRLAHSPPLMANMVEGGKTPMHDAVALQAMGFSLVIFPGGIVRAIARQAQDFYAALKEQGTTDRFRERMFDFNQLNGLIGTAEMLALGKSYETLP